MFEHLDDPVGYQPAPELKARVIARGRARRHRRLAAGTSLGVIVLAVALVGGAVAVANHKLSDIKRIHVASVGSGPRPAAGQPMVVLFVGVDTRTGPEAAATGVAGSRSDTMIAARIDPAHNAMTILPLPRDLWVDIPGHGNGRLNSAIVFGGPDLLVRTVEGLLGTTVDRYVQVDFAGARSIGDALGGLRLSFAAPVRDFNTGLDLPGGCQTLNGTQLLQLARSRHLEEHLPDGRWWYDPRGDLGRIDRQQAIAQALLKRLTQVDGHDPVQLAHLVDAVGPSLTLDSGTNNSELIRLVRDIVGSMDATLQVGVTDAVHGGAAVLEPTDLPALARLFRGDQPPAAPPSSTTPSTTTGGDITRPAEIHAEPC